LNRGWRFCRPLARPVGLSIEAKMAGEEIVAPAGSRRHPVVVNLMDARKKSLAAVSATKETPAKAARCPTSREAQTHITTKQSWNRPVDAAIGTAVSSLRAKKRPVR
jgi:hypothetical protein